MKRILFIHFTIVLLFTVGIGASCTKERSIHPVSPVLLDYLDWQEGSYWIMKDNSGKKDTLSIERTSFDMQSEFNSYSIYFKVASDSSIRYIQIFQGGISMNIINVKKSFNTYSYLFSIGIPINVGDSIAKSNIKILSTNLYKTKIVDGISYSDVYESACVNLYYNHVDTILFNYGNGLIRLIENYNNKKTHRVLISSKIVRK